jgi:hypothetical protein
MGSKLETGDSAETDEEDNLMSYQDAVLAVDEELARLGVGPSAIREACDHVAAEKAAGKWMQINGEAINHNNENVEEFCARLLKLKPHYLLMGEEIDRAGAAWVGLEGKPPTLKAQAERVQEIGERAAHVEAAQYGTKLGSLQIGAKPGTAPTGETNKGRPAGGPNNPWSKDFAGSEELRAEKIASIMKQGTKFAADIAKAAGTTIGKPLRR